MTLVSTGPSLLNSVKLLNKEYGLALLYKPRWVSLVSLIKEPKLLTKTFKVDAWAHWCCNNLEGSLGTVPC